ncbi:MAG TPA: 16S rRNA (adenine(1518)-N(6)/adenine(1519)-N(6))-dimethyltransferase RsmA [Acidobacteriota bacterium]
MPKSAKLGQNFLHDRNIAAKIIDAFLPQAGPVLEIGPGPGILSALLLEKVPAERVTLVELDRFLAGKLKERFGDPPRVIQEDILKVDLARLYPQDRVAIIGNLPYHISKELIDWLIAQRETIGEAVLMLQRDFVDKLLSRENNKKYNAQSVVFQLLFQARRCFHVAAGAFVPQPKVVSTVIAARPLEPPLPDVGEFYGFVRQCFAERRKTLWNNLATRLDKKALAALAAASGLPATARAEQLPPDVFPGLFVAATGDAR